MKMKNISISTGSKGQNRLLLNNPKRDFERVNRREIQVGPISLSRVGQKADTNPDTKKTEKAGQIKTTKLPVYNPGGSTGVSSVPVKAPKANIANFLGVK